MNNIRRSTLGSKVFTLEATFNDAQAQIEQREGWSGRNNLDLFAAAVTTFIIQGGSDAFTVCEQKGIDDDTLYRYLDTAVTAEHLHISAQPENETSELVASTRLAFQNAMGRQYDRAKVLPLYFQYLIALVQAGKYKEIVRESDVAIENISVWMNRFCEQEEPNAADVPLQSTEVAYEIVNVYTLDGYYSLNESRHKSEEVFFERLKALNPGSAYGLNFRGDFPDRNNRIRIVKSGFNTLMSTFLGMIALEYKSSLADEWYDEMWYGIEEFTTVLPQKRDSLSSSYNISYEKDEFATMYPGTALARMLTLCKYGLLNSIITNIDWGNISNPDEVSEKISAAAVALREIVWGETFAMPISQEELDHILFSMLIKGTIETQNRHT